MSGKNSSQNFNAKRRKLLKFLGLGSAIFLSKPGTTQIRVTRPTREIPNATFIPQYISITLLRPFDLLSLELRYYNFNLSGTTLQKKGNPAYVVVIFQPQSMSEQAWNEVQGVMDTPTIPGMMLIGAESRLVFSIPATISSISLDVKELLAWEKYDIVVNERAKQPAGKFSINPILSPKIEKIQNRINKVSRVKTILTGKGISKDDRRVLNKILIPEENNSRADAITRFNENLRVLAKDPVGPIGELETSLEVPMRLYLSPTKLAGWNHLKKMNPEKGILKETNRLFELWHTRMGTKDKNGKIDESIFSIEQRIVRALWADDANKNYNAFVDSNEDSFLKLSSMTKKDRHQIVHESSNYQISKFVPPPIKAYKLFLTTLGAWLDSELVVKRKELEDAGVLFGNGNALNLLKWRHIETLGREHYVEIVKAGNIMPFGHEAVLVKITERKPHPGTGTAANFQRKFVVITEPVKEYNYRDTKNEFMNFSFSRVEIVTTVSPDIDPNKKTLISSLPGGKLDPVLDPGESAPPAADLQFVIISKGVEVPFKVKAEDLDGNFADFTIPLAFVSTDALGTATNIKALTDAYNTGSKVKNYTDFKGQKFTLAPQTVEENNQEYKGCDTAFVAHTVTFKTRVYTNADEPQGFLPVLSTAEIIEPSYQKLTGNSQKVSVSLVDDKNKGHVFAKFEFKEAVNFSGQSDKTGGLATPNFNLSGLSRVAGAFGGDINKFKTATAEAGDVFSVTNIPDPKIFGVIKLSDILSFAGGGLDSYDIKKTLDQRMPKIPNLITEETADEYITSYVIKPEVKSKSISSFVKFTANSSVFSIVTKAKIKKANLTAPPVFGTEAYLTSFDIDLATDLISIKFNKISFKTEAGKKADVSVEMGNPCVKFGGALSFINALNSIIPEDGFSDPPYLDVSVSGIKCGYSLAIPNVQMGAFSLSNMTLGAEVNLPFTGSPLTFRFNFCERQQPFCLTVSFLGGGGFFALELDLNGIRQIEASIEFGASASINLGVASGGVSIMAGIYFKMELVNGDNSTTLTGYVRINGALCILGLITASIELYMALTYMSNPKKAYGEASLKMKIEVLFFSTSVTLHTKKTFAGSGKDPNFQMAIKENEWLEYCGAYAA